MRRWLVNLAAALSLVLCVLVLALWVRSYFASDAISFTDNGGATFGVQSSRGQVLVGVMRFGTGPTGAPTGLGVSTAAAVPLEQMLVGRPAFRRFGFAGQSVNDPGAGYRARVLIVPHWFVAALLAVATASKLVDRRLRRSSLRVAAGLCPSCGYDVRASPGRCPECGAVPTPRRPAAA